MLPAGMLGTVLLLVLAGCGGSVADRDQPRPTREAPAPTSAFCTAVQAGNTAAAPLDTLATRGSAPPEELSNVVDAVRRTNAALLDTAPPEIRTDVDRYVAVVDLQLDALLANGGDLGALQSDAALTERINAPDNVASSTRVREYVAKNCAG